MTHPIDEAVNGAIYTALQMSLPRSNMQPADMLPDAVRLDIALRLCKFAGGNENCFCANKARGEYTVCASTLSISDHIVAAVSVEVQSVLAQRRKRKPKAHQ